MKYPVKVLVLDTVMERGGIETMIMNYLRNMDRSKVKYDFLVNRPYRADFEDEIEALGGRIFRMSPMYPQYFRRYKYEFQTFLLEHPEYRIIHSNLEERSYFPMRIAAGLGVPVRISHAHSVYNKFDAKKAFRDYFRSRLGDYPTHKFACSRMAAVWLYGEKSYNSGEVTILPNAIETDKYRYDLEKRERMRAELGLSGNFVIGNTGRFVYQKNHRFLLDVFKEVHKARPEARLLLLGDGPLREEILQRSVELGLENYVIFIGTVNNVADYLQAMDIFLFPSFDEGLGIAVIEAQAAGLYSIMSDRVPRECDLTGNIGVLPLSAPPAFWAEKVLEKADFRDGMGYKSVRDAGYDIKERASWLQEYYIRALKTYFGSPSIA
ncbi:MAG: glycosyltransferase family 1 protein [Oscillospiraceae bacterium]|nr:glycosyltransferase family 1 protein [Oscillospiraceae bacterium]